MNIITVTQKGNYLMPRYCFNKDYEKWKSLPKKVTVTQKGKELPKKVTELPKKGISKDTIQKTLSKDNKYSLDFEKFWILYPERNGRKVGKAKAYDYFKKINGRYDELIKAVENYASSPDVKKGYAKDPERFLKNKYWEDWIGETKLFDWDNFEFGENKNAE